MQSVSVAFSSRSPSSPGFGFALRWTGAASEAEEKAGRRSGRYLGRALTEGAAGPLQQQGRVGWWGDPTGVVAWWAGRSD